jgi:hypothetical protein
MYTFLDIDEDSVEFIAIIDSLCDKNAIRYQEQAQQLLDQRTLVLNYGDLLFRYELKGMCSHFTISEDGGVTFSEMLNCYTFDTPGGNNMNTFAHQFATTEAKVVTNL